MYIPHQEIKSSQVKSNLPKSSVPHPVWSSGSWPHIPPGRLHRRQGRAAAQPHRIRCDTCDYRDTCTLTAVWPACWPVPRPHAQLPIPQTAPGSAPVAHGFDKTKNLLRIYISLLPKKMMISLLLILRVYTKTSVVVVLDASTSSRPPTSLSSSSSTSSSSGRSTRVNGSRAPCSSVQGGAAPSERQSKAIKRPSRGHQGAINATHLLEEQLLSQRGNQRQSRGHQGAINATHLLEEELLGGRDGALRLEIAARLMRDHQRRHQRQSEAIRQARRDCSSPDEGSIRGVIGGNQRPSGRHAEIAARLGAHLGVQTFLQRGARGGDRGLWEGERVGRAPW